MIRAWLYAATVVALVLVGCKPTQMEQQTVTELTKSMRTHCIGRYLVDLPESFQTNYRATSATLYFGRDENFETVEVQVAEKGVDPERFAAEVGRRRAQIAAEFNDVTSGSMLVMDESLDDRSVLFRYFESAELDNYHSHEIHVLVSDVHVFLKADSYKGVVDPVEARLKRLAKQVRAVSDPQDAGAGFCLGPVVIDADNDYELAAFRFRDGRRVHRDVSLQVDLSTFKQDESEPRLVRRVDSSLSALGFGPKVFRKGQAQLGGMPAEEWLGRHDKDGRIEHGFSVETYPPSPGLDSPVLQLQLKTGGNVPDVPTTGLPPYVPMTASTDAMSAEEVGASLEDAQAIAAWDAIVQSVRSRPGATNSR